MGPRWMAVILTSAVPLSSDRAGLVAAPPCKNAKAHPKNGHRPGRSEWSCRMQWSLQRQQGNVSTSFQLDADQETAATGNWGPAFVAPAFKLQLHFAILNLGPGASRSILAVL